MKNLLIKNDFARRAAGFLVLLSVSFSLLPLGAYGQTTEPPSSRSLVIKEKTLGELPRLALVIGNGGYENIGKLKNAAADASDMTVALQNLGFDVISGIDQNKKQMEQKIRDFGDKLLRQKGVGLFFYAGHGVQSNGKNYLIPIDADIPREDEIADSAIDMQRVIAKFNTAQSDMNIVILDACRNNPFAKDWSEFRAMNSDEGIGKISAPKGTVLLYSTEPGKTASDGAGRNGLFTEALLENIKKPNLELNQLYKAVARKVQEKSKNLQNPYIEGTNVSDFYFAAQPAVDAVLPPPVVKTNETEPEIKETDALTVERESWNVVKNSGNEQDFRSFLESFPNGANAAKARIRLEQIIWDSIKTTSDKIKIQNYLKEFPAGANVPTARLRLHQLEARENAAAEKTEPVKNETAAVETAKAETKEPEETPVKKVPVPKAPARTAKVKVNPSVSGANKYEVKKNALGMELVYLPAGSFMMGSSEADVNASYTLGRKEDAELERSVFDNEKSQHRVTFAEGFWIGKTEVTQAQWTAVMGENPSRYATCGENCPVERVSWEDAKKFIEKLNARNDGFEYRLPSEAEWEYAARGGKTGMFPFAAARIGDFAWYNTNSGESGLNTKPSPVGTLQPNAFGLYDMHGNVAEWCEDAYTENYDNSPTDGSANLNGDLKTRVLRGGFFNDLSYRLRLTRRNKLTTEIRRSENGLRVVAVEKK